jgi:hypothetical protein
VQLGQIAQKLEPLGVRTLGVVATEPERARLYFRFRRPRMPVGADPGLVTHRAFGVPNVGASPPGLEELLDRAAARELGLGGSTSGALAQLARHDGYAVTGEDHADQERHQAQLTGQFLVDRAGLVRWANIECAREGIEGIGKLPAEDEVLAAARGLSVTIGDGP